MSPTTHVVKGKGPADRLMLLAHGYGADEVDLSGLMEYLDPQGRFVAVFPRGPVSASPGYAWYEIDWSGGTRTLPDVLPALDALDEALDEACEKYGLARSEAIVGGFSQGAGLALLLALRKGGRAHPAGVLVMSGYFAEPEGMEMDWDGVAAMPVCVQHGTFDPLIPSAMGLATSRTLHERGLPVTFTEYPMAHQVALESMGDARAWLDLVVAGERPSNMEALVSASALAEGTADGDSGAGEADVDRDDGTVRAVRTRSFAAEVLASEVPVIVDFWAPWCGPCRAVSPIVEQIAAMRKGAYRVFKVNIDEEPALAQEYGVQSIPMIALFRNGRLERSSLGAKPRQQLEAELGLLVIP